MMRSLQPTFAEISSLPVVLEGTVPSEFIDANGHMNVTRYFKILTDATIQSCAEFGLWPDYQKDFRMGLYGVEHHARYLREILQDGRYSAHVRLINATDRAIHTMAFLIHQDTSQLTTTLETLFLNVDLETRRATPFNQSTVRALSASHRREKEREWSPQLSGVIRAPGRDLPE